MVDTIVRAFVNDVIAKSTIPPAIKESVMDEDLIVIELVVTFGSMFLFNGTLKAIHTRSSEGMMFFK